MKKNNLKFNKIALALSLGLFLVIFSGTALASEITPAKIIKMVNESRVEQGLLPLEENEKLNAVAEDKVSDMIKNKYFAHTSPNGVSPWFWFSENGYDYKYAGENLAINFLSVEEEHKAWMKSPTHRKNILNSNYQEIGVAVAAGEIGGETSIIAVQEFGTQVLAGAPSVKKQTEDGNLNLKAEFDPKIEPTVLSVKKVAEDLKPKGPIEGDKPTNIFEEIKNKFYQNREALIEFGYALTFLLIILSLLSAPALLLINSFEKMIGFTKLKQM